MRSNELPFERRTFAPDFHTKKALFNQGFRFSLLAFIFPAGPLRRLESPARLNAGSAATLMLIVNGDNQIDFVYDACVA